MLRIVTRNLGWKVLSVFLATVLWILVHAEPDRPLGGPPRAEFHEPLLSRDLPVEVRLTGIPPKGYVLTGVESIPGSTRIQGPQLSVAPVESIATDPIDVSHFTTSQTLTIPLHLPAPHTRWEGPSEVRVHLVVQQKR